MDAMEQPLILPSSSQMRHAQPQPLPQQQASPREAEQRHLRWHDEARGCIRCPLSLAVLAQYEMLPKRGKPQDHEHTVLAGIALTLPHSSWLPAGRAGRGPQVGHALQQEPGGIVKGPAYSASWQDGPSPPLVLALATGTKCLPASRRDLAGRAVNDCHAEVACRRAFLRWLYLEALEAVQQYRAGQKGGTAVLRLQRRVPVQPGGSLRGGTTTRLEAQGSHSARCHALDEPEPAAARLQQLLQLWEFGLQPGVRLHMYVSQPPCGDASILEGVEGQQGGGVPAEPAALGPQQWCGDASLRRGAAGVAGTASPSAPSLPHPAAEGGGQASDPTPSLPGEAWGAPDGTGTPAAGAAGGGYRVGQPGAAGVAGGEPPASSISTFFSSGGGGGPFGRTGAKPIKRPKMPTEAHPALASPAAVVAAAAGASKGAGHLEGDPQGLRRERTAGPESVAAECDPGKALRSTGAAQGRRASGPAVQLGTARAAACLPQGGGFGGVPQAHEVESYGEGQAVGVPRRKPGRGEATLSMSCSDKLARWHLLGLQGCLLSALLPAPLTLTTLSVALHKPPAAAVPPSLNPTPTPDPAGAAAAAGGQAAVLAAAAGRSLLRAVVGRTACAAQGLPPASHWQQLGVPGDGAPPTLSLRIHCPWGSSLGGSSQGEHVQHPQQARGEHGQGGAHAAQPQRQLEVEPIAAAESGEAVENEAGVAVGGGARQGATWEHMRRLGLVAGGGRRVAGGSSLVWHAPPSTSFLASGGLREAGVKAGAGQDGPKLSGGGVESEVVVVVRGGEQEAVAGTTGLKLGHSRKGGGLPPPAAAPSICKAALLGLFWDLLEELASLPTLDQTPDSRQISTPLLHGSRPGAEGGGGGSPPGIHIKEYSEVGSPSALHGEQSPRCSGGGGGSPPGIHVKEYSEVGSPSALLGKQSPRCSGGGGGSPPGIHVKEYSEVGSPSALLGEQSPRCSGGGDVGEEGKGAAPEEPPTHPLPAAKPCPASQGVALRGQVRQLRRELTYRTVKRVAGGGGYLQQWGRVRRDEGGVLGGWIPKPPHLEDFTGGLYPR